jgi:hypothetical protein
MSFGRNKNMVRRRVRPDGQFHRMKRRKRLNHPMAGTGSVIESLFHLLATPFRRRER